ncbi:MAG: helix-turn-helix transcriptional regulator [Oscillospiraceae bacterium]|nr:helix-turn-helix transcriptional regulator [Oscillospiraceae bacterium]
MNIGAKIRLLRKEKRVTQEELAEYLHISAQAVSKWETGASSPDIDLLPKLAIYFGTSLDHLLDFDQSQVEAAVEALVRESGRGGDDPAKSEAFLRKALEKYPNNDLLLTCILEDMQEQNGDKSRSAEIIEIGERILACSRDDEMRIDVMRIMAETYHGMGEQAMAEYYLEKIPGLHFLYYEIAAAVKSGRERLENVEKTENLCIDKLICALWMRREEADEQGRAAIDAQARETFAFFKGYPAYAHIAEIMEQLWNEGTIMSIYQ